MKRCWTLCDKIRNKKGQHMKDNKDDNGRNRDGHCLRGRGIFEVIIRTYYQQIYRCIFFLSIYIYYFYIYLKFLTPINISHNLNVETNVDLPHYENNECGNWSVRSHLEQNRYNCGNNRFSVSLLICFMKDDPAADLQQRLVSQYNGEIGEYLYDVIMAHELNLYNII